MKKTELQNFRDMNKTDLSKELPSSLDRLWQLRVDIAAGKTENIKEIKKLKKVIALIKTLIKEKGE